MTQAKDVSGDVAVNIKEQLVEVRDDIKAMLDERETATSERIAEIEKSLDTLKAVETKLDELQKESEAYRVDGIEVGTGKDDFSFARFVLGLCLESKGERNVWGTKVKGPEGNYLDEMRSRAASGKVKTYSGSTDAAGGHLIGTDVQAGIIDLLREQSVIYQAGARRMDGLTQNISWNVNAGGTTAYWVDTEAEESITESASTFSTINASPKPLAALSKLSWGMMQQPAESVDAFIRQEIATVLGLAESEAAFTGSGASGQPRGIMNQGISTQAVAFSSNSFGTANAPGTPANIKTITATFRSYPQKLRTNKALGLPGARYAWVVEDAVAIDVETAMDNDARPLFLRDEDALVDRLYRYPLLVNLHSGFAGTSSDRTLLFGDFNQCVIPHWGAMEFSASDSDDDDFKKGRMTIRAITALDVAVLQKNAFVEATSYND